MGIRFAQITVVGTVGRDSELGATPNGTQNLKFSLASDLGDDKTAWYNVTLWGNTAEKMQQFIKKGQQLAVAGRFVPREYVDKNGKDRTSLDINADNVQLVGGRREESASVGNTSAADEVDEDVPF